MASSGKKSDLEAPSFGVGFVGGSVKSGQPNLKRAEQMKQEVAGLLVCQLLIIKPRKAGNRQYLLVGMEKCARFFSP